MHFTFLIVATLAAASSASPVVERQNNCPPNPGSTIPSCGLPCVLTVIGNSGCPPNDYTCICRKFTSLFGSATDCILTNCGGSQGLLAVLKSVSAVCAACA